MADKMPGGTIYEKGATGYFTEDQAVNLEAIHRQLIAGGPSVAAAEAAAVRAESAAQAAAVAVPRRGVVTTATDAAALPAESGQWDFLASTVVSGSTGLPSNRAGALTQVLPAPTVGYRTYGTFGAGPTAGLWLSMRNGASWTPWRPLATTETVLGILPAGTNLDTYRTPGQALVRNDTDANSMTGLPVKWPGVFTNFQPTDASPLGGQLYFSYGAQAGLWWRVSSNVSGGWTSWKRIDAPAADPSTATRDLGLEHTVRRADMIRRRTVRVTTPAVVVMVFDHGLTVVRDTLHQLMAARGLPYTLAINPGRMGTHDNTGVTWDDVKTLVSSGLVEPGNHSWSHNGATDSAGYVHEIEDSRREIETRLGVPVDTWVQPSNSFGGFTTSGDVSLYHSTEAGRLIVGTHGAATGTTGTGTHRLGSPLLGAGGTWIDAAGSTAGMLSGIDATVASGGVRIVRHHPQYLGASGRLPVSEMTSFLDAVVQRRDAGKITVLPFASAAAATL